MTFVCPLPPVKCFIRSEYLYDFEKGHGDVVEAIWCSVKAIRGEAFRFESYLPQYGALYDKLPISAYLWNKDAAKNKDLLDLDLLQIWDALAYHVTIIEKPLLKGLKSCFYGKDRLMHWGEYMFTLDTCSPDPRIPDFTFSETVDEHKSYNMIKLDNGQYALQPNNRCLFLEPAFNPENLKTPDFKVATVKWRVEKEAKWRLGDTNSFNYEKIKK